MRSLQEDFPELEEGPAAPTGERPVAQVLRHGGDQTEMSAMEQQTEDAPLRRNNVGLYAQGWRWCKRCGEKRREQRCPVCHLLTRGRDFNYPPSKKRLAELDSRPLKEVEKDA